MAIELEDGTIVRSLPEQVAYNDERIIDNTQEITDLKTKVEAALAGVFHYKGSVATYADLPASDNQVGDVWNVIDTGKNYAWSGSAWDDLGGAVDLSNLVTLNTDQTISGVKTFSNGLNVGSGNLLRASSSGVVSLKVGSNTYFTFSESGTSLYASSGNSLGNAGNKWKDLFLSGLISIGSGILKYDSALSSFTVNSHLSPATTGSYDLGSSTNKFKDLYLSGRAYIPDIVASPHDFVLYREDGTTQAFNFGNASGQASIRYTFVPMNDNSISLGISNKRWLNGNFSGQVYAQNTFNLINASDIVSNTLTQEQYDLITNGKITLVNGSWNGYTCIIKDFVDYDTNNVSVLVERTDVYRRTFFTKAIINKNTRLVSFEANNVGYNYQGRLLIGEKAVPVNPSNTGTFTFKCVNGVFSWVED